ncbi:MAG: hypothetical protein ACI35W_03630 [Anaeroplasmataceae bacterium]
MKNKNKRAFLILFFAFIVSDICSYIKFFIEHKGAKLDEINIFSFDFLYNGEILSVKNIAAIFFIICATISFIGKLFYRELK